MGSATMEQRRTRPSLARARSPASSRTRTCLETAGKEIGNRFPSFVTDAGPRARRPSMARRVGSARAPKVAFNELDTIRAIVDMIIVNLKVKYTARDGPCQVGAPA